MMLTINDGYHTLKLCSQGSQILVELPGQVITLGNRTVINHLLQIDDPFFLVGQLEAVSERGQLRYQNPHHWLDLLTAAQHSRLLGRLQMAEQVMILARLPHCQNQIVWHPQNLLWTTGQQVKVIHRGLHGLLGPTAQTEQVQLAQIKALVLNLIFPRQKYHELVHDNYLIAEKHPRKLVRTILASQSLASLAQVIEQEVEIRAPKIKKKQLLVNKKRYRIGQLSIVALAGACLTTGFLLNEGNHRNQFQKEVIAAHTAFHQGQYPATMLALNKEKIAKMNRATQYILAISAVRSVELSQQQELNVLQDISFQTPDNRLYYWIYIGRENYQQALSLAKNLDDNQLILYAYARLHDSVQKDTELAGEQKQKLLAEYQQAINDYGKKVGGTVNGLDFKPPKG